MAVHSRMKAFTDVPRLASQDKLTLYSTKNINSAQ